MATYVIGVLVAMVLAIPTYGLSFVTFVVGKHLVDSSKVSMIAAAAANSLSADDAVVIPCVSNGAVRRFFKRHGSTVKKFESFDEPMLFFVGFVRLLGDDEYAVVVARSGDPLVVSSMRPPIRFGNDMLSLLHKQKFISDIVASLQPGSGRVAA